MSEFDDFLCRLCGRTLPAYPATDQVSQDPKVINCGVCGIYEIDETAWLLFRDPLTAPTDRHLLSALTRTAPARGVGRERITCDSFKRLREGAIVEKTFTERRAGLLDWLAYLSRRDRKAPYGAVVQLDPMKDYPVAYCRDLRDGNHTEWGFILQHLLKTGLVSDLGNGLRITEAGWEQLESLPRATGAQGFIAMAFKDMDHVHEAIAAAIEAAGYRPLRIDRSEFVGGVMDEITVRIRESRFVVADLTHNRGGVYYEAGFALGRGIQVIPTCRKDQLDEGSANRVHFDMQGLNMLPWEEGNLGDFTKRLEFRIASVFGRGPFLKAEI
jgi:hypothetical protein